MNEETQETAVEETQIDLATEKEARQNGWVPKEQYRGNPDEWMDADAFARKGREINPILRKNNERLQRDLDGAKAELQELKLTTKEFAAEFAKMKENAYKRAITELKSQRRDALKDDNLELVDELEDRIEGLKEEQVKRVEPKKEESKSSPDLTILNNWRAENQWYDMNKEPELFDMAEAVALRLSKQEPGLAGREFLDKVGEIVRERYPDKFENTRRKAAAHEGGGKRSEGKRGKSYADLPADAKQACDRYTKQGLMTKEQYLEAFEWE